MENKALIKAAGDNDIQTVRRLLASKADVNQKDQEGNTALIQAARYQRTQVVCELLSKNANIDQTNNEGDTALIFASRNGQVEPAIELMNQGANIHHQNHAGKTALDIALWNGCKSISSFIQQLGPEQMEYKKIKPKLKSVFLIQMNEFGYFSNKAKLKEAELPKEIFDIIDDYVRPVGISKNF